MKRRAVLNDHTDWVRSVAWSPDGTRLATASLDGTARIRPPKSPITYVCETIEGLYNPARLEPFVGADRANETCDS